MLEGTNKCDTALRKEIIRLLDPIINSGIPSNVTSNVTPVPTITPAPSSKPSGNADINKCITNTIEILDKRFNEYEPKINYQDLLKNSSASYEQLLPELETRFDTDLISAIKEISLNSFSGFIDDALTAVGFEDARIYFKQGSRKNERPLYIPQFQHGTETLNKVNLDIEYVRGWNLQSAYGILLDIKYLLIQLLISSVVIRDLTQLKEKNNIDKYSLALQIGTFAIEQANNLNRVYKLFANWKIHNISDADDIKGYFSKHIWYNILDKTAFLFLDDSATYDFITPIIQEYLLNCITT